MPQNVALLYGTLLRNLRLEKS